MHSITRLILCPALIMVSLNSGSAQVSEPATVVSSADNQSAVEFSKQASNPLANLWLLQSQQNNQWIGMPPDAEHRIESNLQFQPLMSVPLTENWKLFARPVLQLFNSSPYQDQTGRDRRITGFGDTVLAFAVSPGPALVGRWLLAAGPTFILPTAAETALGQKKWQFGPTTAVGYVGKSFITYAFAQQWFGIAGNSRKTNQMNTYYAFVYAFSNGWSIGTSPNFAVNWEGSKGNKVSFPVGPQIGKLVKIGAMPVKFELQALYYPIHPDVYAPKWNVQLQVTPLLPALIKRKLL